MNNKILIMAVTCLFLVFISPVQCLAQDFEGGLHISIPSNWTETSLDNKNLDIIYHGTCSSEDLEMGIYTKRNFQTNKVNNWMDESKEEITKQTTLALSNQKEKENAKMDSSFKINDTKQMRFLVLTGSVTNEENQKVYTTQYTTIVNGGSLQFSFYSTKPLNAQQINIADSIVESAYYDQITNQKYDTKLILTAVGIIIVIILLILSVVWNIIRYRKKIRMEGDNSNDNTSENRECD